MFDAQSIPSGWSEPFRFTTCTTSDDLNFNGIPDDQEVDDTVDLDNNGVPDIYQDDIKCVKTVVGDAQAGVKGTVNVSEIAAVRSIHPDTISDTVNKPGILTFGVISFKIKNNNPGDTAGVIIYFSKPAPDGAIWYKYDPVNGWQDYAMHATFSSDRKSFSLELKDGDFGDADGTPNGLIIDPGGIGLNEIPHTDAPGGGGGGGGGCFIFSAYR